MVKVVKDKRDYFVILDRNFIQNSKLSWKARGIFTYLWSQDESWEFYQKEVAKHATDGMDSLRSGLKELEEQGYLTRRRIRDKQGHWGEAEWTLHEKPTKTTNEPKSENPSYDTAMCGNQTLISNNLNKQQQNKQEREEHQENAFEAFAKTNATLNGFTRPQLVDAIDRFGDDVVTFAINRMAEQATYPSFSFLNKKLNDYEDANVKSVDEAEEFEKKRAETAEKKPQRSAKPKHHSIKDTWDKEHERKEKLKQEYMAKYGEVPVNLDTLMDRPNIKPMFKADEEKEMAELGISEDDMPW